MKRESGVLQFTPTPVFEKFLFDKGANCNRDCPFKVAFGEGQSLWPHNCTGSTPISGVIGVGVKSNEGILILISIFLLTTFFVICIL